MSDWLLFPVSLIVLYAGLMILKLVFRELDTYHAANPRPHGGKLSGGRGGW